eukprot:4435351-Prymnesium_polylepis.1
MEDHQNASHARAVARYESKWGPLKETAAGVAPSSLPSVPPDPEVDPPLANLIRTTITAALSKSALRLVPMLIELQRANGAAILSMNENSDGIQQFVHAGAVLLQREQTERLRKAGMFSKMGDGSSDRKTTEQVGNMLTPAATPNAQP